MTTRREVRVDVSAEVGIAGAEIAATVIAPTSVAPNPVVAMGFPGGGYSRGYWDIQWPGDYSQAEYHAAAGWIFVAVDHLGVGDSSAVDPSLLTIELLARANAAATESIVSQLREDAGGELRVIGVGQSMGGCVSIVTQGAHRAFDALAVLGCSASHTVLPSPAGGIAVTTVERGRTDEEAIAATAAQIGDVHTFAWSFHYEDVDREIYHEDLRGGFPFRTEGVPPWGSATIPPAAASMLTPGVVAAEAAAVDVPVFIGVGERDVCPDPRSEPACYRSAADITLFEVDRMAHMHNFAGSRRLLWERLHRWGSGLI